MAALVIFVIKLLIMYLPYNPFHQTRVQLQVVPQNLLYVGENSCMSYSAMTVSTPFSCNVLTQQVY